MAGKRPPLPLILTANALLDGDVIFYTGTGWSPRLADALVARDDDGAVRLEAGQQQSEVRGEVVEPYLASVHVDAQGRLLPRHYRERIRVKGPTIRADLGPQAAGEARHVSV
jgi:hypothetical protein